jgi:hypothetical protein
MQNLQRTPRQPVDAGVKIQVEARGHAEALAVDGLCER